MPRHMVWEQAVLRHGHLWHSGAARQQAPGRSECPQVTEQQGRVRDWDGRVKAGQV